MLEELKKSWRVFTKSRPGERFQRLYGARKEPRLYRILLTMVGVLLLVGGVVLLFIPGPGLLLIAFGAALIARESLWLAKRLDRLEPVLHKLGRKARSFWKKASTGARAAIVAAGVIGAAGAAYAAYLWLLKQ